MKRLIVVITLLTVPLLALSQYYPLKSARHGLDLIFSSKITKEQIIDDVLFLDGQDSIVDIVRFDNVGTGSGEGRLIISSKKPIQSDEVGLISFDLQKDSLSSLLDLITRLNTAVHKSISSDGYCFRITYRNKRNISQYYISTKESATNIFKQIEKKLLSLGDGESHYRFYEFLYGTRLIEKTSGTTIRWKY
jgi:hypothetical protein